MAYRWRTFRFAIVSIALVALGFPWLAADRPAAASTLQQLISREDPSFGVASSRLAVGKDGLVYLSSYVWGASAIVVRYTPDGGGKFGGAVVADGLQNAAANANGIVATANAHFARSVNLYDTTLKQIGGVNDFLVSDAAGWDAPGDVEAGDSGDFYGVDQHRNRIVRVSPGGKEVTTYPIAVVEEKMPTLSEFRVCEKTKCFYFRENGDIRCVGWDGKTKWKTASPVGGDPWNGFSGGFDVDSNGELYFIGPQDQVVKKVTPDGNPDGTIALQMGESVPTQTSHIMDMRLSSSRIFIKRNDPIEVFSSYDIATGAQKSVVHADVEKFTVDYPSDTWTAGAPIPVAVKLDAGARTISPQWHVWLRPFETVQYKEMPIGGGKITPPASAAGLYQFKVSAGTQGDADSEYMVQSIVEIRPPGSKGSATVMTPGSREYYGRGEEIPVTVELRGAAADLPKSITLSLVDARGAVASCSLPVPAVGKPVTATLSKAFTARLSPGTYRLTVSAAGLTCMAQPLIIGPGMQAASPFRNVQYGDYSFTFPSATFWNSPEVIANNLTRDMKLGKNFFADRLGSYGVGVLQWTNDANGQPGLNAIADTLGKDPIAVAGDKLHDDGPYLQTVAAYGAHGICELGILMGMDAGLPIGTLWDSRKPEVVKPIISDVTKALLGYPAFHGWVWAANWWPSKMGADAAVDDTQKAAYNAAIKVAKDTGKWDPVIDQVASIWQNYIPNATQDFASVLKSVDPTKVSDDSGPYRSIDVYPPVSFKDADEIDLQYQSEQIQPPMVYPHDVDFQKRPGKPEWAHPELWNDNGTGDQILPTSLMMMMRGTDGVGNSGNVPNWGRLPEDPRQSYYGNTSEFRALGTLTNDYGPWLTTLYNADSVAIVCSPRMFRIDTDWLGIGGKHFTRVYEAYQACMYAHHPASIVFLDDMTPTTLKQYKAVLVVDQTVDMEPQLKAYLDAANASGTPVFYDDTCRKTLMTGYHPLGVAFNQIETASMWNDDSAFYQGTLIFHSDAAIVAKALDPVVKEIVSVDKPDVLTSVRASGKGRYVFVVNNTLPPVDPGILWRMDNYITTHMPVTAKVTLADGGAVYDAFAYHDVTGAPAIQADLGPLPGRIYAILPARIARVVVRGPKSVRAGQPFDWAASVLDSSGNAIDAGIPVRLSLTAGDGSVVENRTLSANIPAARGEMTAPYDVPGGKLTLCVTELLSGKWAQLTILVTRGAVLTSFDAAAIPAVPANATVYSPGLTLTSPAPDNRFGQHFRDIAINNDGDSFLATAMGWDANLLAGAASVAPASLVGTRPSLFKIGNGFAYAPQAAGDGFAAIGYDVNSPQGYFLYLLDRSGVPERRFGLYGLPKRMRSWATPHLSDNDYHFAVAPNGSWVATSGDLGLALWSSDGKLIASHGSLATRRSDPIFAAGNDTLVVPDNMNVTGYDAKTGTSLWNLTLAPTGSITGGISSADGHTIALIATTEGGRIYILHDGKPIATLNTPAEDASFSPDASHLAVTHNSQLLWYDVSQGLQWSFSGDDTLHFPRIDRQGTRIVASSELGTLYVLSTSGSLLLKRDMGALAAPVWLPSGGLILATWMGDLDHLTPTYHDVWRWHFDSVRGRDASKELTAVDTTPSVTVDGWTNSTPTVAPLTPNLLKDTNALIQICGGDRPDELQNPVALLTDGLDDPPAKPWMNWTAVNYIDSGWTGGTSIVFDTWRTQLHVTGMTFIEDPAHPESWLRDMVVQYWDPVAEQWLTGPTLLSNSAQHTHMFDKPIEASKFRLVTSGGGQWPAGNVRLAEVVLHGTSLGSSNPDVLAKRPVAVLFDEKETDVKTMVGFGSNWKFNYADAYSGGKSIEVEANQQTGPTYQPPYGHAIPNWDFPIAENPGPGEYRYLTFAWKAGSPQTTGMAIWVGLNWPGGGAAAAIGPIPWHEGIVSTLNVGNTPPQQWTKVTVDMWQAFKKPIHVYAMGLSATGGPALFDDITLRRTPPQ